MNKLAYAIVGFNFINKYQPNANQWKRIIELFNEEFDDSISLVDNEYTLAMKFKTFINTNYIPKRDEWLTIVSLCEDIINTNYDYTLNKSGEIDFIKDDIDESITNTKSTIYDKSCYSCQEDTDNIIYYFHNMDKEEVNELFSIDILNNFVDSSYIDPQSKLKF